MNFVFRSPARGGVPGRVGSVVQREHRGPDREEGHGTDQQRRRPPRPKPQPQDPHAPEPPLSRVAFFKLFLSGISRTFQEEGATSRLETFQLQILLPCYSYHFYLQAVFFFFC